MDYVTPPELIQAGLSAAEKKASLAARHLLIRGFLAGAILSYATSLAFVVSSQGLPPVVGAILATRIGTPVDSSPAIFPSLIFPPPTIRQRRPLSFRNTGNNRIVSFYPKPSLKGTSVFEAFPTHSQ